MTTGAVARRMSRLRNVQTWPATAYTQMAKTLGMTTYKPIGLNEDWGTPDFEIQSNPSKTTSTTLSNGIRVVSRYTPDPIVNLGFYINAGSRYCTPETSGIGHFMESLAVEGTPNISPDRFQENLHRTGTNIQCQSFRDAIVYQAECFPRHADFALESLAELIWNPDLQDWNLHRLHQEYLWRRGDMMRDPEHEIPEYMHQAAYQGNTVGLPMFCDPVNIHQMSARVIQEYIDVFYQPNRVILAATGNITHDELERLATQSLNTLKQDPQFSNLPFDSARYTGGEKKLKYDFESLDEHHQQTHVSLIFETESWKSEDLMSLCVLNMMMGGGGSFSAGGPGKGMYTRLYRDILGNNHWIEHISCSHSIFDDTGIFSIYGVSSPEQSGDLVGVILRSALDMVKRPPNDTELERSKKSLASNICFEFENRQVVFEDLARQIHVFGNHRTPEMWRDEIMNITSNDVVRVAQRILSSKPTLLAMGNNIDRVPTLSEVEEAIQSQI